MLAMRKRLRCSRRMNKTTELENALRVARAALETASRYYMPTPATIEVRNAINAINATLGVERPREWDGALIQR